jgi:hypothetical protein
VHQRPRRHQDVVGVRPVSRAPAISHAALWTELLIPHGAHFANATTTVVVHHHPIANGERLWGTWPELCNDVTGFMASDHLGWLGGTVAVQVGTTESRGTDLHHRFTRASMGAGNSRISASRFPLNTTPRIPALLCEGNTPALLPPLLSRQYAVDSHHTHGNQGLKAVC